MERKTWRPKGWEKQEFFVGLHNCGDSYCLDRARASQKRRTFEAGADAMLKAILKRVRKLTPLRTYGEMLIGSAEDGYEIFREKLLKELKETKNE